MAGNDFVLVQLTDAGVALADGHPLQVQSGGRTFRFLPGIPVRVERSYEWNAVLAPYNHNGESLFEAAPEQTVAPTAPVVETEAPGVVTTHFGAAPSSSEREN